MPLHQSKKLMKQTADLIVASPQVITHRINQMALAPFTLSPVAMQEIYTMTTEKVLATQQSWLAMSTEITTLNQRYINSMLSSFWTPWAKQPSDTISALDYQRESLRALNKGVAPIRDTAVSNAERLKSI
ncbi:MAG: Unknown protein [uncultured Thiotrichaceae bacterium]|uniref:Phasin domain-containing protein n=1 Tax=uncultured Thiotrichaceae bacterium TaxID=298394 RepID=A0A6S6U457_9GAMM|nr:MAG: Unknown protein [uncultured Thiotrichaceae bacterium]